MPSSQCRIGVWEDNSFRGVVLFGIGAGASTNGQKYRLGKRGEVAELVRVALRSHITPVSKMLSIAIKMMKKKNPGIRLVISFADEYTQGHLGTIYQAGNWIYTGTFEGDGGFVIFGKTIHSRTVGSRGWKQTIEWIRKNVDSNVKKAKTRKHRYLMPLDAEIRQRIEPLAKSYPKRPKQAMAPQGHSGGAAPTRTLQDFTGEKAVRDASA